MKNTLYSHPFKSNAKKKLVGQLNYNILVFQRLFSFDFMYCNPYHIYDKKNQVFKTKYMYVKCFDIIDIFCENAYINLLRLNCSHLFDDC